MDLGLRLVVRPAVSGILPHCRGRFLLAELAALDAAAASGALRPLSDFVDPRELPEDFEGEPREVDALLEEWTEWFSLEQGLAALEDLIHCLENDPACRCLLASPERTLFELRDLERCLESVAGRAETFRLEIG